VRSLANKKPFLYIFGACYVVINYDFTLSGQLVSSHDKISCAQDEKILVGNSIAVYYNPEDPAQNVTELALATKPADLFSHARLGIVGTAIMAIAWQIIRHRQRQAFEKQYDLID
ncbi:MAG TPA: hypothetical protein VJJ83_01210, partial [Candidatus Babeliales bacterium]|nr:hypothetical protein [Candidatus Babeliales bacterium]